MELKKATIQCTSPDCPWQGRGDEYKVGIFVNTCSITLNIGCPVTIFRCETIIFPLLVINIWAV
jgi:hypothetical protein